MGLPVEVNNLMMGAVGGYQISRSLRFRNSATAYLSRSPASAGNQQKMTFSFWAKRGQLGVSRGIYCSGASGSGATQGGAFIQFTGADTLTVNQQTNNAYDWILTPTQVFRDPSAWYHIVVAIDTTQATASNRVLMYVNGVQVTSFSSVTYPTLNLSTKFNASGATNLGATIDAGAVYFPFDGYLADVYFIDGQALTPSSFGETDSITGVWNPKKYSGTYGTNGFYLNFSDNSGATATTIGKDYSGNGNNWTPNNISVTTGTTYDSMIDSPTPYADGGNGRGNYAVLNPLPKNGVQNGTYTTATISNGNLLATGGAINTTWTACSSMVLPTTGKWYFEVTMSATAYGNGAAGLFSLSNSSANCYARLAVGVILNGSTSYTYTGYNTGSTNRIGIAYDADNNKYWQTDVSGTWLNSKTPGVDTTGLVSGLTAAGDYVVGWFYNSGGESNLTASVNFGQQPFSYTQPTGFKALNSYNLPAASISNGAKHFAASLWTGDATTPKAVVSNLSFSPDFVWIKDRSVGYQHSLQDTVRGTGASKKLYSSLTEAENGANSVYGHINSFDANGFTVATGSSGAQHVNASGVTYVGWSWKGGGTAVTNNSGTISSQVSANTSAGFSIVTYTGNGTAGATVGHGLGVAPNMILIKNRSSVSSWLVYSSVIGASNFLVLNATDASAASALPFNNTAPTSSVFSLGTSGGTNVNGSNFAAYCFAAVRGFSAFGSYTGNGSADGPFVYTGFAPRFVMWKRTDTTSNWYIEDSSRLGYNSSTSPYELYPNLSNAEATNGSPILLSNGFKLVSTGAAYNASGGTYIYAAFAESPFNLSRAR